MTSVRIGLGQMLVVPGDLPGNLERARDMVKQAAWAGCRIIVLPECMDVGWTDERARDLATTIPGATTDTLSALAREFDIMIASGVTERNGDAVHNAAVLIDSTGRIVLQHRKINELDFAKQLYTTGTELKVADTEFGRIALNICADNYVDSLELAAAQAAMGATLLLSPSSWAVPPGHDDDATPYVEWETPYALIGERHGVPVVGVSNVGPVTTGEWTGWVCIGRSLATDATGAIVAKGPYGIDAAELLQIELELA